MSETALPAFRGGKRSFSPFRHDDGLKNKLGNALAASDTSRLRRRIEQHDKNFSRIIGINDADALRDDKTVARAEPAAGIQETGHARLFGLGSLQRGCAEA